MTPHDEKTVQLFAMLEELTALVKLLAAELETRDTRIAELEGELEKRDGKLSLAKAFLAPMVRDWEDDWDWPAFPEGTAQEAIAGAIDEEECA